MRSNSQSLKVSNYLKQRLEAMSVSVDLLDLYNLKLPMYDDGETDAANKPELLERLANGDGYVFVSPEWDGMMSHGLTNMLLYVRHEMAHKPVMLVGVSSGRGGAYPIAQMKQLGQKNRHYVISPENLIVGSVKDTLNDQEMDESSADYGVKRRAEYSLRVLVEYAKALEGIRSSGTIDMSIVPKGV